MRATALMLILAALAMSACNTVRGVGKDVEAVGGAIQKSTK